MTGYTDVYINAIFSAFRNTKVHSVPYEKEKYLPYLSLVEMVRIRNFIPFIWGKVRQGTP